MAPNPNTHPGFPRWGGSFVALAGERPDPVRFKDQVFHRPCFTCDDCSQRLTSDAHVMDGGFFCFACAMRRVQTGEAIKSD